MNTVNSSIKNLINIYKKGLINLNKSLISHINTNPLTSIFINQNKLNLISSFYKNNQVILNNKTSNSINLLLNKKDINSINENNKVINHTNKDKLSVLINKLKINNKSNNRIDILNSNFNSLNLNKKIKLNNLNNIRNYIKSKTTFNSKIANILAISNNYKFIKYNHINTNIKNNIYEFLYRAFFSMNCIISKPIFILTHDKIILQLFYLFIKKENSNLNKSKSLLLNNNNLNNICKVLTRFFNKPIELDLIRIYYPYFNSNILVNFLSIFINKIHLRKIINKFITKIIKNKTSNKFYSNRNKLLTDISGINIKVAGRLLTQRIVPRKTIKIISRGALARNKALFLETARFTNKNKRGAFSITISIGHKLVNS